MKSHSAYDMLHSIYAKHRRKHNENPDSKQMCCMWSIDDPPDTIEDTEPILEIEGSFEISIGEDTAMELYDMDLEAAAIRILEIRREMG